MKTKDDLNALKEEVKDLNKKLSELSEDELSQVSGGEADNSCPKNLEKMDADCVDPHFSVCPYAHRKQNKYVCSLGKGEFSGSFFVG